MSETTLIAGTDTSGKLTRADLALVPTPYSTSTHQVIPHIDIVQALEEQLGFRHIAIASEEYAVTKDGKNFFGVMTLDQGMDGASFALGVRNSHSKQFRLSIVVGLRIFVCSKGEGDEAENFHLASTLSQDSFPTKEFDFMLSNPPYGKSWKTDLDRMGGKGDVRDPRFVIEHAGDAEYSLITRSSDGQLMFLANKLSKMKRKTAGGSRIAEVHNGSSLFTGDAGQGESNIRRWILENDWLEAIIALPLNTFYNTGIATFIWVLSNRKAEHRRGKVQLIDASAWFRPLRKNLGKKNCELSEEDILRVTDTFLAFKENDKSQIFPNEAFGYWKITVERPLRLVVDLSAPERAKFRQVCKDVDDEPLANLIDRIGETLGVGPHSDFNVFLKAVEQDADTHTMKLTGKRQNLLRAALGRKDEKAAPIIKKLHKAGKAQANPIAGLFAIEIDGTQRLVEYEPDSELRDTEQIPLLEEGGVNAFFCREVLPYAPDAWIDQSATKIGYEISFTKYFYRTPPLRTLQEIRNDIESVEKENIGLLNELFRC